jgi:hypothetical protein
MLRKKHNKNAVTTCVGHSIGHDQAEVQCTSKMELFQDYVFSSQMSNAVAILILLFQKV